MRTKEEINKDLFDIDFKREKLLKELNEVTCGDKKKELIGKWFRKSYLGFDSIAYVTDVVNESVWNLSVKAETWTYTYQRIGNKNFSHLVTNSISITEFETDICPIYQEITEEEAKEQISHFIKELNEN